MKQTTNYNLTKLELTDSPPDITAINPNWDTIDAELKEREDNEVAHAAVTGNASTNGHVKLSDSTSSTSAARAGIAASPKAVKSAYDRASTGITNAATAQAAAEAAQTTANNAMPKSAGAVIGANVFGRNVDNNYLYLTGGTGTSKGGALLVCGKDYSFMAGQVRLRAHDGTNTNTLSICPNGETTVNDKHLVRSVNNTVADAAGNVTIDTSTKAHASTATTYGIGTSSNYGHVKLSDSTSSTSAASAGIAASPKAVKAAYDRASTGITNAATAQTAAEAAQTTANAALPKEGGTLTGDIIINNNDPWILMKHNQITVGSVPSANEYAGIRFQDKNGSVYWADMFAQYRSNGDNQIVFTVRNVNGDGATAHTMGLYLTAAGVPYAYCPTPPTTDNSTKIATTKWVQAAPFIREVVTLAQRNVDNSYLTLHGGSAAANGAGIWLYGKDVSSTPGSFRIRAHNGTSNVDLIGHANGNLLWNGKSLLANNVTPNYSAKVKLSTSITSYTAPSLGWLMGITGAPGTAEQLVYVNNVLIAQDAGSYGMVQILLDKNDVVTFSAVGTNMNVHFVPCKGV